MRPGVQVSMWVQADLDECPRCKGPWAVESPLRVYNDVYGDLKAARLGVGRRRFFRSRSRPSIIACLRVALNARSLKLSLRRFLRSPLSEGNVAGIRRHSRIGYRAPVGDLLGRRS